VKLLKTKRSLNHIINKHFMIKNVFHGDKFPVEALPSFSASNLNWADYQYHKLLIQILEEGVWKTNRTGVKTISIFGPQVEFHDVANKFPLLTTKRIHLKSVIGELLWFLSGSTNKHVLKEKYGVSIWDEWGDDKTGELGPVYGHQWVAWRDYKTRWIDAISGPGMEIPLEINQIQNLIDTLKKNPDDRRMIVNAWNVAQISEMALPPCHWSFQCESRQYPNEEKRRLNLKMNIRSWDIFLGGPFNISSYAILLLMLAQEVDMIPGTLTISAGDVHIYENHLEYIYKQLGRSSKASEPIMKLNPNKGFWEFEPNDFELQNYDAHPNWKDVPVAV